MFENLKLQPEDKIMALMSLFRADERKEKNRLRCWSL